MPSDETKANKPPEWEPFKGSDFFAEAIDRNIPVELFRSEQLGRMPAARGRLISADATTVFIDEVQTIGRDVSLPAGQSLEAYFTIGEAIFHFSTAVIDPHCNVRLNQTKVVPGMSVKLPRRVDQGQRRNAFRVSLAMQTQAILTEIFPAPDGTMGKPPEADATPERTGTLVDGSEFGLGLTIPPGRGAGTKRFEHVWVRITLPGEDEPITVLCEVRQVREINSGSSLKVGVLILPWPSPRELQHAMRPLQSLMREAQRAELSRRAG
jgi:c-di-GMP-binding flagellar brake protein YcgR